MSSPISRVQNQPQYTTAPGVDAAALSQQLGNHIEDFTHLIKQINQDPSSINANLSDIASTVNKLNEFIEQNLPNI